MATCSMSVSVSRSDEQGFGAAQATHFDLRPRLRIRYARDVGDLRHADDAADHLAAGKTERIGKQAAHEMRAIAFERACLPPVRR